jgi:hypothetical protein
VASGLSRSVSIIGADTDAAVITPTVVDPVIMRQEEAPVARRSAPLTSARSKN